MADQQQEQYNISGGTNQVAANVGSQVQNFYGDEFIRKMANRKEHPITMVVTGADVDATLGLPTSANLIPRIADFLATDEGKAIDAALRKAVGSVRFSFDKFVEKAVDDLAQNLDRELVAIYRNVNRELESNGSLTDDHRKLGKLIVLLFHKIIDVKENASIDSETEGLIQDVLGTNVTDDTIIDFSRLSYTETFRTVIVEILRKSMHESDNPILRHVYRNIFDIDQLLSQYFYGFYQDRPGYIRTYMYISWILWAYLISEEQRIAAAHAEDSTLPDMPAVYTQLRGMDADIVTFCYTSFARTAKPAAHYFHGSLMEYVDVENKNDIPLGNLQTLDILDFFQHRLARQINFGTSDDPHRSLPIPSFLPPLKLKPVISKRYIDVWYQTGEMLKHAKRIILLGVTLSTVDPDFADMLRESQAESITIITRDLPAASAALCRILQLSSHAYTPCEVSGHEARKYGNRIIVIEAAPDDINLEAI